MSGFRPSGVRVAPWPLFLAASNGTAPTFRGHIASLHLRRVHPKHDWSTAKPHVCDPALRSVSPTGPPLLQHPNFLGAFPRPASPAWSATTSNRRTSVQPSEATPMESLPEIQPAVRCVRSTSYVPVVVHGSVHPGKIISLQAMGQTLIVVDDPEIAVNLLEKRSGIYSSRPDSIVVDLLVRASYRLL